MAIESQGSEAPASGETQVSEGSAPAAGADPAAGSSAGAVPPGQPDVAALQRQLASVLEENKRFKAEHAGLRSKLDAVSGGRKTAEERIADLEAKHLAAEERASKAERESRRKSAIDRAVEGVPDSMRKTARAVAQSVTIDGLDSEDPSAAEAATKALQKQLQAEHPALFQATPNTARPGHGPPAPSNGVADTKVGFFRDGIRLA